MFIFNQLSVQELVTFHISRRIWQISLHKRTSVNCEWKGRIEVILDVRERS